MPAVSVVIPTYEQDPDFLRKAVESALAQSFEDLEVIVVDDGSSTPAAEVLGEIGDHPKVTVIRQENAGAPAARNHGVREAKGELIALLDSDDLWETNKVAKHVEAHAAHPEWVLTFSQSAFLLDGKVNKIKPRRAPSGMIFVPLVRKSYITTCSVVVVKREVYLGAGGLKESLRICDDYELFFRLAREHPFGFIPEPLTFYRAHTGNITRNVRRIHEEKVEIFGGLVELAGKTGDRPLDRAARRKLAYHLVRLAREKARAGEVEPAREDLRRAVKICPTSVKAWRALGKLAVKRLFGGKGEATPE